MKCAKCGHDMNDNARFCGECGEPVVQKAAAPAAPQIDISGLRTIDEESETRPPRSDAELKVMQPGDVFGGRYTIIQVVGEGGMGVVYKANDKLTEKDVALKLIRADRLAGKDAVKRLIREGVTSRDIRHPNVIAVYDVGEVDGQPFMSMEFIGGQSLRSWNRKRMQSSTECPMKAAANIINEILAGLDAAHKAGVVHRDLKPENVMLLTEPTADGAQLKILDFGVARAAGAGDTGATSLGTRGYMAPEQITAPDAAQPSADLYSLSVMFYELLVGVVPQGHWQPPSGGRSDVPPGIDALVQQGLSNNPRTRPQNCLDYGRALAQAMQPTVQRSGGGKSSWDIWVKGIETGDIGTAFKDNLTKNLGDLGIHIGGQKPQQPAPQQTVYTPPPVSTVPQPAGMPENSANYWKWFMFSFMKRYAAGKGRAHRKEYWAFNIFAAVFIFIGVAIDTSSWQSGTLEYGQAAVSSLVLIALIAPAFALASRRAHDLGYNGWIGGIAALTFIGNIWLGLQRGTPGDNAYGPDPLAGVAVGAPA